jgi:hypothetical protein
MVNGLCVRTLKHAHVDHPGPPNAIHDHETLHTDGRLGSLHHKRALSVSCSPLTVDDITLGRATSPHVAQASRSCASGKILLFPSHRPISGRAQVKPEYPW